MGLKISVLERVADFIYGYCAVSISCPAEKALTAMLESGINYWSLERTENGISFCLPEREVKKLRKIMEAKHCEITDVVYRGAKSTAKRHIRPGIIVGAFIFASVLWASTYFVFDITIEGNKTINDFDIIKSFEPYGVKFGAFIPSLDLDALCGQYVIDSDNIGWASVNLSGTTANIVIRERSDGGGAWNDGTPSNLIAAEDGMIKQFCIWSGDAQIHLSQVVKKGDLLVSGVTDIIDKQTDSVIGYSLDRSYGTVMAQVCREYTVEVPLEYDAKTYTGKQYTEKNYKFFTKALKTFAKSEKNDGFYDKITDNERVILFSLVKLPIFVETNVYREYAAQRVTLNEAQAEELAQAKMMQKLAKELAGCTLEKRTFDGKCEGGVYTLRCTVYCIADIAKEVEITNGAKNSEN